ncbi:glycosyltransferase family 4 protein [Butyrivibrio fibrisolvens]|uniref:glycosyltransferase family 4 protein n=1 Tax=Butyrivibrio fibrisolvens TaxID=831 RepID=UPI0003B78C01|nr:glycosyltransferase family 4 protein [Butyrivibrio fibrisolvens]
MSKLKILIIMGRYLPGYKDGGPVRSIKNLTDYYGDKYDFEILTLDRDHGDDCQYKGIKENDWNDVGKAHVYYVKPGGFRINIIRRLALDVDIVYVCGCFSDYALKVMMLKKTGIIKAPVIIAPMGLFSPLEFHRKYVKKKTFTTIINIFGLVNNIYWSCTSDMEASDLIREIRTDKSRIYIAEDLPRIVDEADIYKEKEVNTLKVIWLSRINPQKNLIGSIKMLQKCNDNIELSIYGTNEDSDEWNACLVELNKLPENVKWIYKGVAESEKVVDIFKQYHVFLLQTKGENFGHAIQEALSGGCPCVISNLTPWQDLEKNNAGFVLSLENESAFLKALHYYYIMDEKEFNDCVGCAHAYAVNASNARISNSGYEKIFSAVTNN